VNWLKLPTDSADEAEFEARALKTKGEPHLIESENGRLGNKFLGV